MCRRCRRCAGRTAAMSDEGFQGCWAPRTSAAPVPGCPGCGGRRRLKDVPKVKRRILRANVAIPRSSADDPTCAPGERRALGGAPSDATACGVGRSWPIRVVRPRPLLLHGVRPLDALPWPLLTPLVVIPLGTASPQEVTDFDGPPPMRWVTDYRPSLTFGTAPAIPMGSAAGWRCERHDAALTFTVAG